MNRVPSRKPAKEMLLEEHPTSCPMPMGKVAVCGMKLSGTRRSGFKAGHGQFKNYCDQHGTIYYDLVANKPQAVTEE